MSKEREKMSNRIRRKKTRHELRRDEQLALMMMVHFPEVIACGSGERLEALTCRECGDYENGSCPGKGLSGWLCVDCMNRKIDHGERFVMCG